MAHTIKNEIFQWIKELTVLSFFRKIEQRNLNGGRLEDEAHEAVAWRMKHTKRDGSENFRSRKSGSKPVRGAPFMLSDWGV